MVPGDKTIVQAERTGNRRNARVCAPPRCSSSVTRRASWADHPFQVAVGAWSDDDGAMGMELPPRSSWWSRNWKWALPVGCVLPIALCGGGFVAFFLLILSAVSSGVKSSDAYEEAMTRARSNAEVRAQLGEPIETGFWITGSISVSGPSGDIDVAIPISGPKGSGTLYIVGRKTAGQWQYSRMDVAVDGRDGRIDLRPGRPSAADEHDTIQGEPAHA